MLTLKDLNDQTFIRSRIEQDFWTSLTIGPVEQCWVWSGPFDRNHQYGVFKKKYFESRVFFLAHRLSFYINNNYEDPGDLLVCHRCDNPPCVNPHHLFKGTQSDNMKDRFEKLRSRKK